VRLDHLLSKELPRMGGQTGVMSTWVFLLVISTRLRVGGVAGWNTSQDFSHIRV
jgi:hypothetical protein